MGDDQFVRTEDFERVYQLYSQPLYGFLCYRTGDRHLAEDLLADTFERVFSARRRFDRQKGSEKSWIYAIALNCYRDQLRRRGAEARAIERVAAGAETLDTGAIARADDRTAVIEALGCLSEEERDSIALRFGADLTIPEIAEITGLPATTVEGRVYRSLGKLRTRLSSDS